MSKHPIESVRKVLYHDSAASAPTFEERFRHYPKWLHATRYAGALLFIEGDAFDPQITSPFFRVINSGNFSPAMLKLLEPMDLRNDMEGVSVGYQKLREGQRRG